jgi:hypothetical protein
LAEVRTLQLLNEAGCPNIVTVADADPSPPGRELPWFVMPFYGAGAMSRQVSGQPTYVEDYKGNIPRALAVVRDIARALDFIHTLTGAPHRDVKCHTIFFDAVGGPPVLGDFGLTVSLDVDGPETALGETIGPARWRPPELRSGSPNKRHCGTDIYQLGGVLYEALTGGDAIDDVEQRGHFRHELPELTIARFTSDPRVEWVNGLLRHMLRNEPDQRFAAARVVALCDQILAWSPGERAPEVPLSNEADEAAARYHARQRTMEVEVTQAELRAICDRVAAHFNLGVDAPRHGVSKRIDTNMGDPPFAVLKGEYPGSVWMAVRVKVDFEPPGSRLLRMSYVFVGRLDPQREIVGIYNENQQWRPLAEGVPGSPKHHDLMVAAAGDELTRLVKKIATEIDEM